MNIPLGDTSFVKWIDGGTTYDLNYLVLNGTTIWEKVITFTGTATYSPINKNVEYSISGDRVGEFTKWSYQAVRQGDGSDTGEVFVTGGALLTSSGVLGVDQDGTWDVTFKGYVDDTVRGTTTATVTVATPFIEITSQELIAPPPVSVESFTYSWYNKQGIGGYYENRRFLIINNANTSSGTCSINTKLDAAGTYTHFNYNGTWSIDMDGNISGTVDGTDFNIDKPVNGWKTSGPIPTNNYTQTNDMSYLNWRYEGINQYNNAPASTLMFPGTYPY